MFQPSAVKAGQAITALPPDVIGAVIAHPAHRTNGKRVVALIEQLRECDTPADYSDFQKVLFGYLYGVEAARAKCSRIIKRMKHGASVPSDQPPLPEGADPLKQATWEFEAFVYERIARQLRCVGDGLAWRRFGFDRRVILALSRNSSPGPMFGKTGLPYELGRVEQLWSENGHFALLHDLTNCLRIADISEFTNDGKVWLREIKRTPHTEPRQLARTQAAVDAIMTGGPLPDNPDARLTEVTEPYVTNLGQLADLLQLAKKHGCRGMRLPGGRAIVATSLLHAAFRWHTDIDEGARVLASVKQRATKRAGIANAMHHVTGVSADTAARSPINAPWSIYPFSPVDCAAIIGDLLVFETVLSIDALQTSLAGQGLRSEVLLPPIGGQMAADQDLLRIFGTGKALSVHAPSLGLLLYELVEPQTWARGAAELLKGPSPAGEPVVVFADEGRWWR